MSDDANLTPKQEADLRRLLAEARHDDPMPDDVASRLDRVLAQLAAGDSELDPEIVVALASRRRRVASTLLVAAAAVVAIGVGLGQVIPIGDNSDANPSADSADVSPLRAESGDAPESPVDGLRAYAAAAAPAPRGRVAEVRSLHFTTDVSLVGLRYGLERSANLSEVNGDVVQPSPTSPQSSYDSAGGAAESDDNGADLTSAKSSYVCAPAVWGRGRKVAALYDGEPAVLVFRKPMGDSQVVDLLQCGTGDILRSVTLSR